MKPRHVEARGVRRSKFLVDLVERQRRGVDDARAGRAVREQFTWHDRAGVETNRTARDEIATAHGDKVRRARPGADEMHGHNAPLGICPEAASAHVAAPTTSRGLMRRAAGPAAASAAASATDGTPVSANTRSERVSVRSAAVLRSTSETAMTETPSVFAAA